MKVWLRRWLARRRRLVMLSLAALAVVALVPGLGRLATDNSPRVFFVEDSAGVAEYERFRELFGSDKVARIAVSGDGLWTGPGLAWLRDLEDAVGNLPEVQAVSGLASHYRRGPGWPPSDPAVFRRRALADPLNRDLGWLGGGGRVASLLVVLEELDNRQKRRLVERLEAAVRETLAPTGTGLSARVVGTPVLDRALDASSEEIGRRYFPLLVVLAVVLLLAVFRDVRAVVVPLVFVGLAELVLLGTMGHAGVALNLVLAVLPPLLFVISLATAVHVLVRFRDFRQEGLEPHAAAAATYRDKGWAVLWTGISTFVGFASLAVSKVGPVRSLGLWSGAGIAAMTVLAFTLLPVLLPAAGPGTAVRSRPFETFFQRRGRRWAEWAVRNRAVVLSVAGLTAALALAGVPRIEIETNALHYLPPEHPVRRDIETLEREGIGMIALEVMLTRPDGFDDLESFGALAELSETVRQEPLVLGAVSAGDLLEDAVRQAPGGSFFGRSTVLRVAFDELLAGGAEQGALGSFLAADGTVARLTVFTETVGYDRLQPLEERIEMAARQAFPGSEVVATGEFPLVLESQRQLLRTLGLSLTLTLLAVTLIFRFLLPSTRLTILAMLPNLWPVLGVVGVMGWLGVPLDVATVMVASVVLGLAVDDTIHTLGHFRKLAPRLGKLEAVASTLERTAPSYVLTGLILGAGFGVCALSDFAPTSRFGMLSAAAIALAVIGDLFLLPALLGATPRSVVERLGRSPP